MFNEVPEKLVDARGRVPFGIFPGSVPLINGRGYDYRTPMGGSASALARHFHYKQFQYFGIVADDLLLGCALADTAWLGVAFLYVFEPATGKMEEHTWRSPLGRSLTLSESPVSGSSRFLQGRTDIRMDYERDKGGLRKTLSVDIPGLSLEADLWEPAEYQPMSLCTRTGINGWVYANKVAGLPVTGTLRRNDDIIDLSSLHAGGHHDFSAGYMRRETFWNWACLSGRTGDQWLGLNLSCGVNETGFTENCLWLDGELLKVDTVRFEYDRDDLLAPWRVTSQDGQVVLAFTPDGRHREHLNLMLFASNFNQIFGRFNGEIHTNDGRHVKVDNLYGFVEEQYAKW